MSEGLTPLCLATIYLATAPKSNSVGTSYLRALDDAKRTLAEPVPLDLRNPETPLMRDMGYGRDYKYDHAFPGHHAGQEPRPRPLRDRTYYVPGEHGYEQRIREWLERLRGRTKHETEES